MISALNAGAPTGRQIQPVSDPRIDHMYQQVEGLAAQVQTVQVQAFGDQEGSLGADIKLLKSLVHGMQRDEGDTVRKQVGTLKQVAVKLNEELVKINETFVKKTDLDSRLASAFNVNDSIQALQSKAIVYDAALPHIQGQIKGLVTKSELRTQVAALTEVQADIKEKYDKFVAAYNDFHAQSMANWVGYATSKTTVKERIDGAIARIEANETSISTIFESISESKIDTDNINATLEAYKKSLMQATEGQQLSAIVQQQQAEMVKYDQKLVMYRDRLKTVSGKFRSAVDGFHDTLGLVVKDLKEGYNATHESYKQMLLKTNEIAAPIHQYLAEYRPVLIDLMQEKNDKIEKKIRDRAAEMVKFIQFLELTRKLGEEYGEWLESRGHTADKDWKFIMDNYENMNKLGETLIDHYETLIGFNGMSVQQPAYPWHKLPFMDQYFDGPTFRIFMINLMKAFVDWGKENGNWFEADVTERPDVEEIYNLFKSKSEKQFVHDKEMKEAEKQQAVRQLLSNLVAWRGDITTDKGEPGHSTIEWRDPIFENQELAEQLFQTVYMTIEHEGYESYFTRHIKGMTVGDFYHFWNNFVEAVLYYVRDFQFTEAQLQFVGMENIYRNFVQMKQQDEIKAQEQKHADQIAAIDSQLRALMKRRCVDWYNSHGQMPMLGGNLNSMIAQLIRDEEVFKQIIDLIDDDSATHGNWILEISQSHDPIEILKVYLTTILAIKTALVKKGSPSSEMDASEWPGFFKYMQYNRKGVELISISQWWLDWHTQYPNFWTS
jgi:hypothetical protein